MKKSIGVFLLLVGMDAVADHPTLALGTDGSGPINTISAQTMPSGSFSMGIRGEILKNQVFSDKILKKAALNGEQDIHSVDSVVSSSVSIAYGVSDRVTLSIRLPYVQRKNIRAGEEEDGEVGVHLHGDTEGIGDVLAFAQYKYYEANKLSLALLGGIKMPTGKTDEYDGVELLDADLQPGSGSWDILAGLSITKVMNKISFHSNVIYQLNSQGVQKTKIGDVFTYNGAIAYNLIGNSNKHFHKDKLVHIDPLKFGLDVFVEVNGEMRQKDIIDGNDNINTGGNMVYLTPGLQLNTNRSLSMFASLGFPIVDDMNGLQTDVNYKAMIGASVGF